MLHPSELTVSDVLRDPMVRLVLRADGISLPAFAMLLREAARRQHRFNALRYASTPPVETIATHNPAEHPSAFIEP